MAYKHAVPILITVVAVLSATATPSVAQTSEGQAVLPATPVPRVEQMVTPSVSLVLEDPAELAKRVSALEQWTREFTEWREWQEQWKGRPEPGLFTTRDRRPKPEPPAWLFDDCENLVDVEDIRAEACKLLVVWQEDYGTTQVRASMLTARTQDEKPTKSSWWSYIHIDGLWITPAASVTYGVVGVHVAFKVAGRWQLFAAPGAILLNVPTPGGTRAWRPATDIGVSYRLIDIKIPGSRRQGTLHVNLAKAWLLGSSASFINSTVDLVGLSVTFK